MTRAEFAAEIKEKYVTNGTGDMGHRFEVYDALFHTGAKLIEYFGNHERIMISVSGGSDSDCIVHLVCTYFPEYLEKIHFVFVNTGLEYNATKRHLSQIEVKYGISIERIRGRSVVSVVKEFGIPVLSKLKSQRAEAYLRDAPWGIRYVKPDPEFKSHFRHDAIFTDNQIAMVDYCKENGIKISANCCNLSKKKPLKKWMKEFNCDLNVTGERKAEGGMRSLTHESCFEEHKDGMHKYMPLWWWSDDVKSTFKDAEGLRYSDCYEIWGMRRTGCVGCPFNLNIADDLQAMYEYEPQLYKACMNVFGKSYELTDRFNCRRKKCLPEFMQMTLTGEIERSEED